VALGLVHQLKAQSHLAVSRFEAAHAFNPNDYDVKQALGLALTYAGSVERGIELMERAERLNPHGTGEPSHLAMAYFFAGRYDDALGAINRVASRDDSPTYWQYKAAIHAQLGQTAEARAAVAEALKLDPRLTVEGEHERRLAMGLAPAGAALLSKALRKAGLPGRKAAQSGEAAQTL
jgi:tetratricopeptide (TPR) repeat protein